MSSYYGDGVIAWFRDSQWHILLDSQLKNSLLPRLRRIRVFAEVLARNGMFYDPEPP